MTHLEFMSIAHHEAGKSENNAGSVLVINNEVIATSYDRTQELNDPVAIAEMDCIRKAGRRNDHASMCLFTTNTPDMLAAGTIVQFGIGKIVISGRQHQSMPIDFLHQHGVNVQFLNTFNPD